VARKQRKAKSGSTGKSSKKKRAAKSAPARTEAKTDRTPPAPAAQTSTAEAAGSPKSGRGPEAPMRVPKERKAKAEAAPLFESWVEALLAVGALMTVTAVAVVFDRYVNRVFDVPKAFALKTGGGLIGIAWVVFALWGPGVRWRSLRLFGGPVLALLAAVGVSTALAFDPATAFNGVYERQFGFQGYLACAGLFAVASTAFQTRRAAVVGFGFVAFASGAVGTYAMLQGYGVDPFHFFEAPNDKVYSFLGNPTFAGNALALAFPLSLVLAGLAVARVARPGTDGGSPAGGLVMAGVGLAVTLLLQIGAGWLVGARAVEVPVGSDELAGYGRQYGAVLGLSLASVAGAAALGNHGPAFLRIRSPDGRRAADGFVAGSLVAAVFGILLGLFHTRTRGAWVGSAVSVVGLFVLFPQIFRHGHPARGRIRWVSYGLLAGLALVSAGWLSVSDGLAARTLRSVVADLNPYREDCGKGQCTRPLLWMESPRVLLDHDETLARLDADREDYNQRTQPGVVPGLPLREELKPVSAPWRTAKVWLFGIGIENYRYAFMSHKSKRLEELDPMTNHDNPHNNYLYLLASLGIVGLSAYLWLVGKAIWVSFRRTLGFGDASESDADAGFDRRAVSLGVLASFFSYAVYSIAGFDSVLCSVFLFFLLGTAAVFFEPNRTEPRRRLPFSASARASVGVAGLATLVLVPLLAATVVEASVVYRADHVFVGGDDALSRRSLDASIRDAKEAIQLHRDESFYRQRLGELYRGKALRTFQRARALQSKGDREKASQLAERGREAVAQAEVALASALHRAWAPENVYITLYQLHARLGRTEEAMQALERALRHSPHLGPVRVSLAQLQLRAGAVEEAWRNARWALDVDSRDPTAQRIYGRAYALLGNPEHARIHLEKALQLRPDDAIAKRYLKELEARPKAPEDAASVQTGSDRAAKDPEEPAARPPEPTEGAPEGGSGPSTSTGPTAGASAPAASATTGTVTKRSAR
jgi:tetratricopeptide (TPR) repeat protein